MINHETLDFFPTNSGINYWYHYISDIPINKLEVSIGINHAVVPRLTMQETFGSKLPRPMSGVTWLPCCLAMEKRSL